METYCVRKTKQNRSMLYLIVLLDINVKVFNMITNKNEAKPMTKHISCYCKCRFNNTTFDSNQKWNSKTSQYEVKTIVNAKKITVGILAHMFVRIVSI